MYQYFSLYDLNLISDYPGTVFYLFAFSLIHQQKRAHFIFRSNSADLTDLKPTRQNTSCNNQNYQKKSKVMLTTSFNSYLSHNNSRTTQTWRPEMLFSLSKWAGWRRARGGETECNPTQPAWTQAGAVCCLRNTRLPPGTGPCMGFTLLCTATERGHQNCSLDGGPQASL